MSRIIADAINELTDGRFPEVDEKALIDFAMRGHSLGRAWRKSRAAQGIEADTAATPKSGVVHESPVAKGDAPNPKGSIHDPGQ